MYKQEKVHNIFRHVQKKKHNNDYFTPKESKNKTLSKLIGLIGHHSSKEKRRLRLQCSMARFINPYINWF